jgi:P-type Ca2+ transporter type 2C
MEINQKFLIENKQVIEKLKSDSKIGLNEKEAQKRLEKNGLNEIKNEQKFSVLKILFRQFTSWLVIILIVAGMLALVLGEFLDGIGIFGIVVLNGVVGFLQEYKAENTMQALNKMVSEKTTVIRNGKKELIDTTKLVTGDIVYLDEGSKVPADTRILESYSLKVDESIITGESLPVNKHAIKKLNEKNYFEGNLRSNTLIVSGSCLGIIFATGMDTSFGKIASMVMEEEKEETLLDKQMNNLGKKLGKMIIGIVILLFILGLFRGIELIEMFMVAVSLGVSAIPEGLPIVITLTLALGIQAIARKKALVRKMSVIESLGAATIICSDKTGTLTVNEMTVRKVFVNKERAVLGEGYNIKDKIRLSTKEEKKLLEICENCNNSFVDLVGKKRIVGDPTEIALKVLARKAKYAKEFVKIDEEPFTSERKMMSTLHKTKNGNELFVKGAPEEILEKCSKILINGRERKLGKKEKKELLEKNKVWAQDALRVLAFAYKKTKENKCIEKDLVFVGLVGMIDPPRKEVKSALEIARKAGIKVKIITGDNALTAKAIAERIGLDIKRVVDGKEIDDLTDHEMKVVLKEANLFARTNPRHKHRIVSLLKEMGEIVAVTGDGVNDAPALKKADVGIAMGIKGTQVSKEAADIILEDDNFATIINIIKEGRRVYANILSFVKFMLSANFDTLAVVGLMTLGGLPLPILPLQVLWINIATDSLPALALGTEEGDPGLMKKHPHKKGEKLIMKFAPFLSAAVLLQIVANTIIFVFGLCLDSMLGINSFDLSQPSIARTMLFTEIVIFELLLVFNCRGIKKSLLKHGFFKNKKLILAVIASFILQLAIIYYPPAQVLFRTVGLGFLEWILIFLLASPALILPQIVSVAGKILKKEFDS